MSIVRTADFYYGAALSALFNNSNKKISAALIMSNENRQLYNLTTDNSECGLFIKYRSGKTDTKTEDYYSWSFSLTGSDKNEIQTLVDEGNNLILALVCGVEGLTDSELALLDRDETQQLIKLGKDSITISRKKGEHAYRIFIGGGRENAMLVTANRFDELF